MASHLNGKFHHPRHCITLSEIVKQDSLTSKMGMWLFLFSEILLFAGLFLLYSVYRSYYPDYFHTGAKELNLYFGFFNTVILLTSSLTMALSVDSFEKNLKSTRMLLLATIVLGVVFLINKYFEWSAKISHGIYPLSDILSNAPSGLRIFFGLYYAMTGLHGLHVAAGVILLLVALIMLKKINHVWIHNAGLYWHLVDIIWIFLFPLFYLIT